VCVVDPEHSVFYDYFLRRDATITGNQGSGVEGIGRPRVEPSFNPDVLDRMIQIPNAASYAAMRFLEGITGRKYGGSTGTCIYGSLQLVNEMAQSGNEGSVVTLAGDPGDRYLDTYYDDEWLAAQGYDIQPYLNQMQHFYETGDWTA
jgi:cysteine synthase A